MHLLKQQDLPAAAVWQLLQQQKPPVAAARHLLQQSKLPVAAMQQLLQVVVLIVPGEGCTTLCSNSSSSDCDLQGSSLHAVAGAFDVLRMNCRAHQLSACGTP